MKFTPDELKRLKKEFPNMRYGSESTLTNASASNFVFTDVEDLRDLCENLVGEDESGNPIDPSSSEDVEVMRYELNNLFSEGKLSTQDFNELMGILS